MSHSDGVGSEIKERKASIRGVKEMQKMIEFYEMVSLNDAALRGTEKLAILQARLALNMFERAMQDFKAVSATPGASAGSLFLMGRAA